MLKLSYVLTFLLAFTSAASAQTVSDLLASAIQKRSPLGLYEAGDFSPGIRNFRNGGRCLLADLELTFKMQSPPWKVRIPALTERLKDSIQNERTQDMTIEIAFFETQLENEIAKVLSLFSRAGDSVVEKRDLCLVSAIFAAPNAVSIGYGFMVFDPRLFFQIIRSPQSNSWSIRAVVAHEFAHQLQVWHRDPTTQKKKDGKLYVRDKELQADCVASAILTKTHQAGSDDESVPFAVALNDAFISLGDFELKQPGSHHGTSYERSLMVDAGTAVAAKTFDRPSALSENFLKGCRDYIDRMNKKYGDELWPFQSQP